MIHATTAPPPSALLNDFLPEVSKSTQIHAQYDWTTGVPDNGNEWRKEVLRRPSLVPLTFPCFVLCLIGVETEGHLDYQGRAGIISIVRWNLRPDILGVDKMGVECQRGCTQHAYLRSSIGKRKDRLCLKLTCPMRQDASLMR